MRITVNTHHVFSIFDVFEGANSLFTVCGKLHVFSWVDPSAEAQFGPANLALLPRGWIKLSEADLRSRVHRSRL